MKTGRLLKFRRGATEIHAYVYQDRARARAALYVMGPASPAQHQPDHELSGSTEAEVEAALHAWIEARYPR